MKVCYTRFEVVFRNATLVFTDQNTFAAAFGMTTPQAMSNKLRRDSWSAKDLAKVAALCGAKLAFILPDGSQLILAPDEE